MNLAGQAPTRPTPGERGYAMVALLVAMSIMAVMMTVAMPVWKQLAQREKEEELVFRGKQYVHAIELYGRKFANTQPPSVDVLVQQRFLRKKFKDPITNEDFLPVTASTAAAGAAAGTQGRGGPGSPPGMGGAQNPPAATPPQSGSRGISSIGTPGSQPVGGIMGVMSKSKNKSIRLYNGKSHYNEWLFVYQPQQQTPGGGGGIAGPPGSRGGTPGVNPIGGVGGVGGNRGGRGAQGGGRGGPGFPGSGFPGGGFPGSGAGFPPNTPPPTPGGPPSRGRG